MSLSFIAAFMAMALVLLPAATTAKLNIGATRQTLNAVEATIKTLGSMAAQVVEETRTLTTPSNTSCSWGCSVPACGVEFSEEKGYVCSEEFGVAATVCGAGNQCGSGLLRNFKESVVSFPPRTDFANAESEAFVCSSKQLDSLFADNNNALRTFVGWQYVADRHGATRVYPGTPQERNAGYCNTFDVRQRPWYINALTGPKDVVIVYDKSGSMGSAHGTNADGTAITRMDSVKKAVQQLLSTFTIEDHIAVVPFSSQAASITGNKTLLRGRRNHTKTLQSFVSQTTSGGGTYFGAAFRTAFEILKNAQDRGESSDCTKIILFLTDGYATDGRDEIMSQISAGQATLAGEGARIFTFSMGDGADDKLPREIACMNNGIWARIAAGVNPIDQMGQYYQFLAASAHQGGETVRWSSPYSDALGQGLSVTASKPIVDNSDPEQPKVMGVAATDISIDKLFKLDAIVGLVDGVQLEEQREALLGELEDELIRRSVCTQRVVSECHLQKSRALAGYVCPANQTAVSTTVRAARADCPQYAVSDSSITQTDFTKFDPAANAGRSLNDALCAPLDPVTRATPGTDLTLQDVMCCAASGTVSSVVAELRVGDACQQPAPVNDIWLAQSTPEAACPAAIEKCSQVFCGCSGYASTKYEHVVVGGNVSSSQKVVCDTATSFSNASSVTCADIQGCAKKYVACVERELVAWKAKPSTVSTTNDADGQHNACKEWQQKIDLDLLFAAVAASSSSEDASSSNGTAAPVGFSSNVEVGCVHHLCVLTGSLPSVLGSGAGCGFSHCSTTCAGITSEVQAIPTPAPVPDDGTVLYTGSAARGVECGGGLLLLLAVLSLLSSMALLV